MWKKKQTEQTDRQTNRMTERGSCTATTRNTCTLQTFIQTLKFYHDASTLIIKLDKTIFSSLNKNCKQLLRKQVK